MRTRSWRALGLVVGVLGSVSLVGVASASVQEQAITLTPDPPGITGTLTDIWATPGNEILGNDDTGLYKWTVAGGWQLLVASVAEPSCQLSDQVSECYDDPISMSWGYGWTYEIGGGEFMTVYPTGSTGDVAINMSENGKMSDVWTTVNVDPRGFVQNTCVDYDYSQFTMLYATSFDFRNYGTVWSSADFGLTWTKTDVDPMDTTGICSLDFDPSNLPPEPPDASVLAAANEAHGARPLGFIGIIHSYVELPKIRMVAADAGIFASVNDGDTWQPQSRGLNLHPNVRAPYTRYGNTLLAGGNNITGSGTVFATGLFRSTNGGVSFTRVTDIPFDIPFDYVHLQSEDVAYGEYLGYDFERVGDYEGPKIFRSINGGASWSPLNEGPYAFEVSGLYGGPTLRLIANGTSLNDVVVVMETINNKYSTYTSNDGGVTWSPETDMTAASGCMPNYGENYVHDNVIMIPATLYNIDSALVGYCRSTDAGITWDFVPVSNTPAFQPGTPIQHDGKLLVFSNDVPYESADDGATFTPVECDGEAIPIGPIEAGEFDSSGALWVVFFDPSGSEPPNVFHSPDSGCSWDLTSVTNAIDDSVEDNVLDIDPDFEVAETSATKLGRTGSRTVRIIGVGKRGSTVAKIYWGPIPTKVRELAVSKKGRILTLKFKAPLRPGQGKLTYTSRCRARGQRTSTVSGSSTTLVQVLEYGGNYKCSVWATNIIGPSLNVNFTKKITR